MSAPGHQSQILLSTSGVNSDCFNAKIFALEKQKKKFGKKHCFRAEQGETCRLINWPTLDPTTSAEVDR